MKKIFLTVAVIAAMGLASCSSTKEAKDEGADLKAKIENCTNPDSLKVYVEQAKAYADKLVSEGKDEAAQAYIDDVAPVVAAKDPSATAIFERISDAAVSVADDAKDAAKAAGDSISAAADAVGDAVSDKVDDAKAATAKAVDDAKADAAKAADEAKTKAADAVQAGADKLKNAIGK